MTNYFASVVFKVSAIQGQEGILFNASNVIILPRTMLRHLFRDDMNYAETFKTLKARYCIAAILLAWYWQPGSQKIVNILVTSEWYGPSLVFQYYAHAVLAIFLFTAAFVTRFEASQIVGRPLVRRDLVLTLFVVIFTFCSSLAIVTIMFVPLSYLLPEFVTWWLTWWSQPVIFLNADGTYPIGGNILSFVSLVILTPVLEEFIFRGYLLHRWTSKWGLPAGILSSSAVFGVVHPDTLAAAITGIGFALLYLKTQSLWTSIAAHSIYNLIVWLWEFYGVANDGLDYYTYTIDHLREDWWYGAIALVVVILMVDRMLRRDKPLGPFALPVSRG